MKRNPLTIVLFVLAAIVAVVLAWFLVKALGWVLQVVFTVVIAGVLLIAGYTWLRGRGRNRV